jgi:hypothetical protein
MCAFPKIFISCKYEVVARDVFPNLRIDFCCLQVNDTNCLVLSFVCVCVCSVSLFPHAYIITGHWAGEQAYK